jgi:hypothetical protein
MRDGRKFLGVENPINVRLSRFSPVFPNLGGISRGGKTGGKPGENRDRRTFIRFLRRWPERHEQVPFEGAPVTHVLSIGRRAPPVAR